MRNIPSDSGFEVFGLCSQVIHRRFTLASAERRETNFGVGAPQENFRYFTQLYFRECSENLLTDENLEIMPHRGDLTRA